MFGKPSARAHASVSFRLFDFSSLKAPNGFTFASVKSLWINRTYLRHFSSMRSACFGVMMLPGASPTYAHTHRNSFTVVTTPNRVDNVICWQFRRKSRRSGDVITACSSSSATFHQRAGRSISTIILAMVFPARRPQPPSGQT